MSKATIHTEKTFEEAIESSLLERGGYEKGNSDNFDRELALDKNTVLRFLKETQKDEWEKLERTHRNEIENKIIQRLVKELDLRGTLEVLRNGFTDMGVKFKMAYFKPESGLNPDTERLYNQNILTITRQLYYSLKDTQKSIDILLSLNGLPIATAEIKNLFTGQDVEDAKKQYKKDRDPRELLFQFKKRTLVHFAIDSEEVFMTTKVDGHKTRYLPFNKGFDNAKGNPVNPDGYKTSYLWEEVWKKDSWLDIVGKFLHIETEEIKTGGKIYKKETIIFPRYHQLDVVRKLAKNAKENGVGKNYLIQHSAGSGKSNSIAWLAYRLSSLHNSSDKRVFDSVIVITDRKVLDRQLQDKIYQFEHVSGVVQKIDKHSDQLADSLKSGTNIIITTLQKFPFVLEKVKDIPNRKYAVIIDEAHSSQGGEASKKMKEVLSVKSLEEAEKEESTDDEDAEDEIRESIRARGKQENISFFAFTATPKNKTLEVFGEKGEDGKFRPFHLYSMRQAIEEGFILDVLENYTTYKTYFRISKEIEDDPALNKKKASTAIGRFLQLHPYNLAQKAEVMIEHFNKLTSKKIGGKAKAMVVTSSRLHAVRYYQEFNKYIKEKKYFHIKTIVAFSGKVQDPDIADMVYSESGLNGFREKELPDRFSSDEYQILLVADKYQTGFDEPLLHTMYVDKKLSGVKAVQTLSRLNRMCSGKEDTFVLDFANEAEVIYASFQPYYERTATEETNPNLLYDQKSKLDSKQVYTLEDINSFCEVFYKPNEEYNIKDQGKLYALLEPSVIRFKDLPTEDDKDDFKHTLTAFVRLYAFLSQIMPFSDVALEKLYAFGKYLLNKLPKKDLSEQLKFTDEIALEYYRLQKTSEGSIALKAEDESTLRSATEIGIKRPTSKKNEKVHLSELIDVLNEKFGTDFDEADKLFFDQIEAELILDENLVEQAKTNPLDNFKYAFEDKFISKVIERMDQNQEIFKKIMDNEDFSGEVKKYLLEKIYKKLNENKG